jgi:hypothetical protein
MEQSMQRPAVLHRIGGRGPQAAVAANAAPAPDTCNRGGRTMTSEVHVTEHAMQRFLTRYPSDLLPRDPEGELRRLYQRAQPLADRQRRRYRSGIRSHGRYLTAEGWVLVVQHNAIVTAIRKDHAANGVNPETAAERIRDWQMYRSGDCARTLQEMSRSLRTKDLKVLARAWRDAGLPHHRRGGHDTFGAFHAEALGAGS